jgi:hypothetical protein
MLFPRIGGKFIRKNRLNLKEAYKRLIENKRSTKNRRRIHKRLYCFLRIGGISTEIKENYNFFSF